MHELGHYIDYLVRPLVRVEDGLHEFVPAFAFNYMVGTAAIKAIEMYGGTDALNQTTRVFLFTLAVTLQIIAAYVVSKSKFIYKTSPAEASANKFEAAHHEGKTVKFLVRRLGDAYVSHRPTVGD